MDSRGLSPSRSKSVPNSTCVPWCRSCRSRAACCVVGIERGNRAGMTDQRGEWLLRAQIKQVNHVVAAAGSDGVLAAPSKGHDFAAANFERHLLGQSRRRPNANPLIFPPVAIKLPSGEKAIAPSVASGPRAKSPSYCDELAQVAICRRARRTPAIAHRARRRRCAYLHPARQSVVVLGRCWHQRCGFADRSQPSRSRAIGAITHAANGERMHGRSQQQLACLHIPYACAAVITRPWRASCRRFGSTSSAPNRCVL